MERLKKKIINDLKSGKGIYTPSLLDYAKKNNISENLVREALKENMAYMTNLSYTDKLNPRRNYMPRRVYSLGHIQYDLAFFPKPTPKKIIGFFLFVDILSQKVYTTLLLNSKSARNCLISFKKFIKQYNNDYNRNPSSLASDREPSLLSNIVRNYFSHKKVELLYFTNSKNHAFYAENKILAIKKLYGQLYNYNSAQKPMYKILDSLTQTLNNRRLSVNNKYTNFTPNKITYKNINRWLSFLNTHDYIRQFDTYMFRPDVYRFKFNKNDYVKIKSRALTEGPKSNKRSFSTLSQKIFIIKSKFLFLSRGGKLCPGYYLEAYTQPKKKNLSINEKLTFASEKNLVKYRNSTG